MQEKLSRQVRKDWEKSHPEIVQIPSTSDSDYVSDESDGDCVLLKVPVVHGNRCQWVKVPAAKRQRATASGNGAGRADMMQQTLEMTRALGSQLAQAPVASTRLDSPNRDTVNHSRDLSSAVPTQLSSACVMFEREPRLFDQSGNNI